MKIKTPQIATGALFFVLAGTGAAHADIAVNLNGQPLATSVSPMQIGGRTLVPMRDIFEALGATLEWNSVAQTITAQKDLTKIQLAIDNANALVNGRNVVLEQPATLVNGRTFVPLRFVAEATGAKVDWNGPLQLISIRSDAFQNSNPALPVDTTQPGVPTLPVTTAPPAWPAQPNQPANPTWPAQPANPIYPPDPVRPPQQNWPVDTGQPVPRAPIGGVDVRDARTINVPDGAVIPVQIDRTLSSATARVGQTFTASVISRRLGDSEFPAGTKIEGRVVEARPSDNNQPGVLDFEWTGAVLPDGTRVPLDGELTSLDTSNVQMTGGHIVANGAKKSDKLKVIGVGAAGGFVLGRVLKTNSTVTTILGAAGGYLFGKSRDKKAQEATVANGTTLGVRLNDDVRYEDVSDYYGYRSKFLRSANLSTDTYDPKDYGFDETAAVPNDRRSADNRDRYDGYDYSDRLDNSNTNTGNIGDIYPEDVNPGPRNPNRRPNRNRPDRGGRNGDGIRTPIIDENRAVAGIQQISVPAGAVIPVTLDMDLSSATARVGQPFTATVISQRIGDSEFPADTKLEGRVIEATPQDGDRPGTLDLEFRNAILPDGTRVPLNGQLTALDDKSVQTQNGRLVAKSTAKKNDRLKVIGIGAAAGFVVGRVIKKDGILPSLLGALGGYVYGLKKDDKPAEAKVAKGTKLGVQITDGINYRDTTNYGDYRTRYLRQS